MLSCVECSVGCISLLDLEHHIKAQHVQWEAFECVVCKVKCSSQIEALRHARTHQEEGEQTVAPVVSFNYSPDSVKSTRVWKMLTQAKIARHQQNPNLNNAVRRTFPNKTRKRSRAAVKKDINGMRRNLWPVEGRSVTPKARKAPKVQRLDKIDQTPRKRGRKITENTVLHKCALCDSLVSVNVKRYHVVKMHLDGQLVSCSSCAYKSPLIANVKSHIGHKCPSGHVIDKREQFGPQLHELVKKCFPDTVAQVDVPAEPAESQLIRASPKRSAKEEAKEKLSQKAKVPKSVRIKGQGPKPKSSKVKVPKVQKSLKDQAGPKTQKVKVPVPRAQLRPRAVVRKMPKRLSRVNGQIKKEPKLVTKRRPKTKIDKSERLLTCALCGTGLKQRYKRSHTAKHHLEGGALVCSDCGYNSPKLSHVKDHVARICTDAHVIDRRGEMAHTLNDLVVQCFPGTTTWKAVDAETHLKRASPKRSAKEEAKEKLSQKAKVPKSVRIKGEGPKTPKVKVPKVRKSLKGQAGPKPPKVEVPVPRAQLRARAVVRKMPKRLSRVNSQIKKEPKLVTKRRPKTKIDKKLDKYPRLNCALCGTGVKALLKRYHVTRAHLEGGALMCSECGYHSPTLSHLKIHVATKLCANARIIDRRHGMAHTIKELVVQCFPGSGKAKKQTDGKAKSQK